MKSHVGFPLVANVVTLNGVMAVILHFGTNYITVVDVRLGLPPFQLRISGSMGGRGFEAPLRCRRCRGGGEWVGGSPLPS